MKATPKPAFLAATALGWITIACPGAAQGQGSDRSDESSQTAAESSTSADLYSVAKRHRLEIRVGHWDSGLHLDALSGGPFSAESSTEDIVGTLSYSHWMQESLAIHATMRALVAETRSMTSSVGTTEHTVVITSASFGVRYYLLPQSLTPLKPFLTGGLGPYLGVESKRELVDFRVVERTHTVGSFGGHLGGGLDVQMGRHLMAGINVGYNVMAPFAEPLAGKKNYGGFEVGAGISVLFGKGVPARQTGS